MDATSLLGKVPFFAEALSPADLEALAQAAGAPTTTAMRC